MTTPTAISNALAMRAAMRMTLAAARRLAKERARVRLSAAIPPLQVATPC